MTRIDSAQSSGHPSEDSWPAASPNDWSRGREADADGPAERSGHTSFGLDTKCNYRDRCPRKGPRSRSSLLGLGSVNAPFTVKVRHGHRVPSSWSSNHAKILRATAIYLAIEASMCKMLLSHQQLRDRSHSRVVKGHAMTTVDEYHSYARGLSSMGCQGSHRRAARTATEFGKRLDASRRGARRSTCPKGSRHALARSAPSTDWDGSGYRVARGVAIRRAR